MSSNIKLPSTPVFSFYGPIIAIALMGLSAYLIISEGTSWHIVVEVVIILLIGMLFGTARHGTEIDPKSWKINNYWVVLGYTIDRFQSLPAIESVVIAKQYKQSSAKAEGAEGRKPKFGLYLLAESKDRILLTLTNAQKAEEFGREIGAALSKPVMMGGKEGFKRLS